MDGSAKTYHDSPLSRSLSRNATLVGAFRVHCLLAGVHVRGSPMLVEVGAGSACPEKCLCTLLSVRRVRCGEILGFFVVMRDEQGWMLTDSSKGCRNSLVNLCLGSSMSL